jgi:hypothetical protein
MCDSGPLDEKHLIDHGVFLGAGARQNRVEIADFGSVRAEPWSVMVHVCQQEIRLSHKRDAPPRVSDAALVCTMNPRSSPSLM